MLVKIEDDELYIREGFFGDEKIKGLQRLLE